MITWSHVLKHIDRLYALTLTKALDLAQSMGSAIEQSSIIKSYQHQERQLSSEIHSVEERKVSSKLCFRCKHH